MEAAAEHLCDAELYNIYLVQPGYCHTPLYNIYMRQHMTAAAHLCQSQCVHNLAFRRLVDIFRGKVDNLVNIKVAGKLDFTHFG